MGRYLKHEIALDFFSLCLADKVVSIFLTFPAEETRFWAPETPFMAEETEFPPSETRFPAPEMREKASKIELIRMILSDVRVTKKRID